MFMGIDVGTSGVKAVLLDENGEIRAQASAPLEVSRLRPLWSEQAPDDWWSATNFAVMELDSNLRAQVRGVGLAGQMHGATVLGVDDRPLRPAMLWNDGRSFAECVELETAQPCSREITGNLAMPGFTAPKLLWLRRHEPAVFAQVRSVLLPKDYVRLCMTGDKASDMSDSAGTLWLDVGARDWSDAMLAATCLSRAHMPRLFEGNAITGTLRAEVAAGWGMERVPVAAGGGDNAAGAIGVGVVNDGDALLSLGTSGVIFVATKAMRPNPNQAVHAFCHCLPSLWHQMSVHLSAASCVDWAARQLGLARPADLIATAASTTPASGPEIFLPFLSGERTPHNDPHLRAGFLGCDNDTNPARLANAVLEGIAFSLADGLLALRQAGTQVKKLSVIGGGARSTHWGRIIAGALDARLEYIVGGEVGPALGAARLATLAVTGASAADTCARPSTSHCIEPDRALVGKLAPKLEYYRRAVAAIRSL